MKTLMGLIIREMSRGESSKSITVLCSELGVVDVFVRGGMKSSKTSSATQLFTYANLCIEEKVNGQGSVSYFLNSIEPENLFYNIRLDAKRTALASYFTELLCYSRIENVRCDEILRLTLNCLYFLNEGSREMELLRSIFEFRMLCEMGYRPNLIGCNTCFVYESDVMHFNFKSGLVYCDDCCYNPDSIFDFRFDKKMLYIFRYIALTDYNRLFNFKISDRCQKILTDFTEKFVGYYFTNDFATLRFYKLL